MQPQSHHGGKAHAAEQMAREVLDSVPLGQLKSEFSPELLHVVHSAAYAPDDQYSTLKGKLSVGYALAWARGKDKVEPAQIRESWAAAPGGLGVKTYQPEEIGKLESYGASFWGLPLPGSSGTAGTLTGKTVFRPAERIPQDLQRLCGEVKKMLRQAKGNDPMEAAMIAAHFKQNFIAIHPYMDGNGRVSRLCAERILKELGMPSPDWSKADFNLNLSVEETAQRMLQHMN
ncbi:MULTISPECIES: Fic family protein [unclassified Acidovorax]|uniref:Fic family protein n=1 Tax=unclassified Acidovorax TaxID=2684926 RepID=UPI0023DE659A|nr:MULTISPECIES: Fic family protein [Comamonadaceae]WOI43843.1 Fic family protein [Paracidovorax avenae]GKT01108.1 Fic family protein [Acidovorax sp. SUPP3434]